MSIETHCRILRKPSSDNAVSAILAALGEGVMGYQIDYPKVAPGAVRGMYATNRYFDTCSIEQLLRRLLELRVSQINGCTYCIDLHKQQALDLGATEDRLANLATWRSSEMFTARERASLHWAEAITLIADGAPSEVAFARLKEHFDDHQIVDLTAIASNMNTLNRMAICLGHQNLAPSQR